jgi:hypothetical protein
MPNPPPSDALLDLLGECREDIGLFHEAILGRPPLHAAQERIARSVVDNTWTVVPTAHALGKTWFAPSIVLGWLYTRPNSIVLTTSPSNTQLVHALWSGIKQAFASSRYPLAGRISEGSASPQLLTIDSKWFAIGFSAAKVESFQGIRPDGGEMLVLVDEASGVDDAIWHAIESLGATSHVVFGNPIRSKCRFRDLYEACVKGTPGYRAICLSAFDSPHAHLTDEEVVARGLPTGLASKTWIDSIRASHGVGSVYWKTRVLAQFPDEDHDSLIESGWLDLAFAAIRDVSRSPGLRTLALDLAKGSGGDRTTGMVTDDLGIQELVADNTISLPSAAALAKRLSEKWGIPHDHIVYDAGGWAGPDMERYLLEVGIHDAVPYRGSASGGIRFANRRSRSAWALRQRLTPDRVRTVPHEHPPLPARMSLAERRRHESHPRGAIPETVTQPPFAMPAAVLGVHADDLRRELSELRYRHDGPKIALETKAEMTARLGHSPDLADTLIMSASIWDYDDETP